jgi:hypothetical protein
VLKILHIVKDEKFVDIAGDLFETSFPEQNEFWAFQSNQNFQYIKRTNVFRKSLLSLFSPALKREVKKFDLVIIHWLGPVACVFINRFSSKSMCWVGWGGDYYEFTDIKLLDEKSSEFESKIKTIFSLYYLQEGLKKLTFFILNQIGWGKKNSIAKLKTFAPVLENEYSMVKERFRNSPFPSYVDWNYGSLEKHLIVGVEGKTVEGNNLLLGNSATLTNNHLAAFDIIKNRKASFSKLIMPLSYGNEVYKKTISNMFKKELRDKFESLDRFMPTDEYFQIILSCRTVVMNHTRQQGYGNIIVALYLGASVYLNIRNPLYEYLKAKGFSVFNIEDLGGTSQISSEVIDKHRALLYSIFAEEKMILKTKKLVEITLQ